MTVIRTEPDASVGPADRPAPAAELASIDRLFGRLPVRAWTYRALRLIMGNVRAPYDRSGVVVTEEHGMVVVRPEAPSGTGAMQLIHGGGFVIGTPYDIAACAAVLARTTGLPVFLSRYRLAPQHPFPAALDDSHAAWSTLQREAGSLGIDPERIVLGGWSAGGGHAAALAQRLADEGGVQPAGQLLVYPMLDDRTAADPSRNTPAHRVWSNANNYFGWSSYLGHEPGEPAAPYAVPARREDLSGLPPAWIGVGTPDLFLHEDRAYADRLRQAGVPVRYVELDGAIHGFDALDPTKPISRAFLADMAAFVTSCVS